MEEKKPQFCKDCLHFDNSNFGSKVCGDCFFYENNQQSNFKYNFNKKASN